MERDANCKMSWDDLREQARLPDLDKITVEPDTIEELLKEIAKNTEPKSNWRSDLVVQIVTGIVLGLLAYGATAGIERVSAMWTPMEAQQGQSGDSETEHITR